MKKRFLILAAVAVSGVAAVVASNVRKAEAGDCIPRFTEPKRNGEECCVKNPKEKCYITLDGYSTLVMGAELEYHSNRY